MFLESLCSELKSIDEMLPDLVEVLGDEVGASKKLGLLQPLTTSRLTPFHTDVDVR